MIRVPYGLQMNIPGGAGLVPFSVFTKIQKGENMTLRAASLEKLPCHVDFPHISAIALFFSLFLIFKKMLRSDGNKQNMFFKSLVIFESGYEINFCQKWLV